jgi:hypothetical protein
MRYVYRYDENGIYIEPVELKDGENIPVDCTEVKPMDSFFQGKFENGQWVESLTQSEIDELVNAPKPVSEFDELKKQQTDLVFSLVMNGVLKWIGMLFAKNDWEVYHDPTRIGMYVQKGKITPEQYKK